jgi:GTP cyclohydrolase-4
MEPLSGQKTQRDTQQQRPAVPAALSRVGVTGLSRIISIKDGTKPDLFYATLDLFADLNPDQAGVHMSRFSEVVEDLAEGLTREPFADVESLAGRMARQVMETQGAVRSEVWIRAQTPIMKLTPVTRRPTQQLYTLIGIGAATAAQTRQVVGVEVNGLTACPCAQDLVKERSRELLVEDGFSAAQAERVLELLPGASHNQRGRGTLLVGAERQLRADDLVRLVERSMSSEIYELLKRPDELYVVDKAHRNPRFVEDVVRAMLRLFADEHPGMPGETFVLARQENYEGIHEHNAFAERFGTLGEIRPELAGESYAVRHTSLADWLTGPAPGVRAGA